MLDVDTGEEYMMLLIKYRRSIHYLLVVYLTQIILIVYSKQLKLNIPEDDDDEDNEDNRLYNYYFLLW